MPQSHTSTAQWQSFELRMRQRRVDRCVQRAREALAAGRIRDAEVAIDEALVLDPENATVAALAARVPLVAARARARHAFRQRLAGVAAVLLLAAGLGWIATGRPAPPSSAEDVMASRGLTATNAGVLPATDLPGVDTLTPPLAETPPPPLEETPPPHIEETPPAPIDVEPGASEHLDGGAPAPGPPAGSPAPPVRTEPAPARASDAPSQAAGTAGVRRQEASAPAARGGGAGGAAPTSAGSRTPAPEPAAAAARTPAPTVAASRTPPPAPPPDVTRAAPPAPSGQPEPPPAVVPEPELPAVARDLSSAGARVDPLPAISTPPPVAAREASPPAVNHEGRVRAVLNRYQAAYNDLDAAAAGGVWPTVDTRALARAFDGLTAQSVSLGQCDVQIRGVAATADCRGQARWTPRVGGGAQSASRRWRFELAQKGEDWVITQATVR